ncbi:MAG TPA: flagellar hook-basal body complex protein FliE [Syntrophales bacterium]|nr:flagellar hook-basal body complex protein FliE [Syntrophales bacterium]
MNDLLIRGDLMPPSIGAEGPAGEKQGGEKNFSTVLRDAVADINKFQLNAEEAIAKVQLDNTTSIHEAVIALEKADISFRAMMQVRNKILEAYQEIMRMQV